MIVYDVSGHIEMMSVSGLRNIARSSEKEFRVDGCFLSVQSDIGNSEYKSNAALNKMSPACKKHPKLMSDVQQFL